MAEQGPTPLLNLFRQWRAGDAAAGNEMAQRFSDWYYALAVSRLGDRAAREPLRRACDRFAQEIPNVTNPNQLVSWAYKVVREELDGAGGRVTEGDIPNAFSREQSPGALLAEARLKLPEARVMLLAHAYDTSFPLERLIQECEAQEGFPVALLHARQELRHWLADEKRLPLGKRGEGVNLDWAPLPLYEAGRMSAASEEPRFERWMLTQYELCRDVAEFATFAVALRGGAFLSSGSPEPAALRPTPAVEAPPPEATPPRGDTRGGSSRLLKGLVLGAGILLLVVVAGVVALLLLQGGAS